MNTISEAMEKGEAYILAEGRELERALCVYHFGNGSLAGVLNALSAFQNDDGGFGHGLECDLQMAGSSVLATSEALILLHSLELHYRHPMMEMALGYLMDAYLPKALCWQFVPPQADQFPRAPWWNYNPDARAARHNPRPQLLGDLLRARNILSEEFIMTLVESVQADLVAEWETLGDHDLLSYLRLYRTPEVPPSLYEVLDDLIPTLVGTIVERDPAKWSGYCLRPYQILEGPDDPLLPLVQDSLQESIAYLMTEQAEDGSWPTTWSWGENYPEVWPKAQKDWLGVVTLDHLLTLKKFGAMVSS